MDDWTRTVDPEKNPAMMLAAMWYIAGKGKGDRNMVIVPYSDRLILLSRYLQQLVMESLGKAYDLDGKEVHQGLNVFGNKGGTDAHAFIQQLNDGRDDFFATFIEVLKDAEKLSITANTEMGTYLHGFLEGLSAALRGKGRQIITIRVPEVDAFTLGMLIALYERAVAIYAEFININAFHQPGVQAYKLAAKGILALREKVMAKLKELGPVEGTAGGDRREGWRTRSGGGDRRTARQGGGELPVRVAQFLQKVQCLDLPHRLILGVRKRRGGTAVPLP